MHFDGNQEDTIGYTVGCVNNIARFSHYLHLNITKFIYRMAGGGQGAKARVAWAMKQALYHHKQRWLGLLPANISVWG